MGDNLVTTLAGLSPGLPPEAWWLPGLMLLILGGTAAYDAWTGRVPDAGIFPGVLATMAIYGLYSGWNVAAGHLFIGFGLAFVIYAINQLYYNWRKQDAIGMGDAKWTALAAMNFSWQAVAVAWGAGAWLGLVWMLALWVAGKLNKKRKPAMQVHFAPFLFLGLLAGLWWFQGR